jgi:16S rRNA C967 or C1407 C5-methylase (RsmB/RsmF family)
MRQVEQFLQQHTDFELHPITAEELQQQGIPPDILTKEGCIATLPHVHRGADGAFAARLRRRPVAA